MRILFSLTYYHPYIGGVETLFKNLAEGLVKHGHTVRVITIQLRGTLTREMINGVEVERVPVPYFGDRYFFTLYGLFWVWNQAGKFDLVHTSGYNSALPGFLGARLVQKPVLFTVLEVLGKRWHNVESNQIISWALRLFEAGITLLPYDRIAAISEATLADSIALGISPESASRIYPGVSVSHNSDKQHLISLRQRANIPEGDFVYIYFGRPGKTKGVEYLLRAAAEIQLQIPNAHLILLIAHEPRADYARILNLLKIVSRAAQISLLSPIENRDELFDLIKDANCIVIPSITEGFGFTTAETCLLGVPIVATRAGSIPEVISGKHILVDPASESALVKGVVQASRGELDFLPLKNFTWDKMVGEYELLYQEILK